MRNWTRFLLYSLLFLCLFQTSFFDPFSSKGYQIHVFSVEESVPVEGTGTKSVITSVPMTFFSAYSLIRDVMDLYC